MDEDELTTPTAGADSAQGTPDEPDAPAVGDLVVDGERVGIFAGPGLVAWLGVPERFDAPVRKG